MKTRAQQINTFNRQLHYTGSLPPGIAVMNPFKNAGVLKLTETFYNKFYHDSRPRRLILGINPGRFGAGATGIPFTDSKRLRQFCGISYEGPVLHEPSSEYVYDLITAYGGVGRFYGDFYINSLCPLGFVEQKAGGRLVNHNYYDTRQLLDMTRPFIEQNIVKQQEISGTGAICCCLGTGRNYEVLSRLNEEHRYFTKIIAIEHPRFVMQYKRKEKEDYIRRHIELLSGEW